MSRWRFKTTPGARCRYLSYFPKRKVGCRAVTPFAHSHRESAKLGVRLQAVTEPGSHPPPQIPENSVSSDFQGSWRTPMCYEQRQTVFLSCLQDWMTSTNDSREHWRWYPQVPGLCPFWLAAHQHGKVLEIQNSQPCSRLTLSAAQTGFPEKMRSFFSPHFGMLLYIHWVWSQAILVSILLIIPIQMKISIETSSPFIKIACNLFMVQHREVSGNKNFKSIIVSTNNRSY